MDTLHTILLESREGRLWTTDHGKLWQMVLKNPHEVLMPEHIIPDMENPTCYVVAPTPGAAWMIAIRAWCIYNPEELDPQPDIDCFLLSYAVYLPEQCVFIGTHTIQSWADLDPSRIEANPFTTVPVKIKRP